MKYAFWNNKGGTGKTSLCFQTITEYAINLARDAVENAWYRFYRAYDTVKFRKDSVETTTHTVKFAWYIVELTKYVVELTWYTFQMAWDIVELIWYTFQIAWDVVETIWYTF